DTPEYEPKAENSCAKLAERSGVGPLELVYDWLMANEGEGLVYFPSFNFAYQHLGHLHTLLTHERIMLSLADGGAHVGFICDVSMPTYLLTHWARDRQGEQLPLAFCVKKQSLDTARVYGLHDRGSIEVGKKADLNLIDFAKLKLGLPKMVYDLPAGGKRLTQSAEGYLATYVNGQAIMRGGEATGVMAGKLLRGPRAL
ncbi:MAG: hypothetical protein RLZZ502_1513, partial [Pseudomonadota bacterium]